MMRAAAAFAFIVSQHVENVWLRIRWILRRLPARVSCLLGSHERRTMRDGRAWCTRPDCRTRGSYLRPRFGERGWID